MLDQITLISARANLQPAVAAYIRDADDRSSSGYGIMVLTVDGDRITEITGMPTRCSSRTLASRRVGRDDVAYDETLAARMREVTSDIDGEVTERKMFGGLAVMLNATCSPALSAAS
jgi:hypothetical protein